MKNLSSLHIRKIFTLRRFGSRCSLVQSRRGRLLSAVLSICLFFGGLVPLIHSTCNMKGAMEHASPNCHSGDGTTASEGYGHDHPPTHTASADNDRNSLPVEPQNNHRCCLVSSIPDIPTLSKATTTFDHSRALVLAFSALVAAVSQLNQAPSSPTPVSWAPPPTDSQALLATFLI